MADETPRRVRAPAPPANAEPESGDDGLLLTAKEAEEVEESRSPTPGVLHETVRLQGEAELARSASALLWSSLAAGMSMGFSMLAPAWLHAHLGESGWGALLGGAGYSVGFLMVILARQQLFTENTLTAVLPVMTHPRPATLMRLLRLWGLVLAGNLVGVAVFSWGVANVDVLDPASRVALHHMIEKLMTHDAAEMFVRAVLAGWIIASLVWILPAVGTAKPWLILLMTSLIGIGTLAHVVAGTAEALYGWFAGIASFEDVVFRFFLPTLAGNVAGGSLIFALISHAQVRSDQPV